MKFFVLLKSFDDLPSIEYAASVQGLPQKPMSDMSSDIVFLIFETAL